jgi:hypothetical protein
MITVFINSNFVTLNHKNLIFTQKFGFAAAVFATADNESRVTVSRYFDRTQQQR